MALLARAAGDLGRGLRFAFWSGFGGFTGHLVHDGQRHLGEDPAGVRALRDHPASPADRSASISFCYKLGASLNYYRNESLGAFSQHPMLVYSRDAHFIFDVAKPCWQESCGARVRFIRG